MEQESSFEWLAAQSGAGQGGKKWSALQPPCASS